MNNSVSTPNNRAESTFLARYDFIIDSIEDNVPYPSEILEPAELERISEYIQEFFGERVEDLFGDSVLVKVGRVEEGSIFGSVVLVLLAGVSAYDFIAKYKDFYESLLLLRRHLRSILRNLFERVFGFNRGPIRVKVTLTRTIKIDTETPIEKQNGRIAPTLTHVLLWYLLITNLFFMVIIAALVYRAIAIVYFGVN